jgi:hypothetical protein
MSLCVILNKIKNPYLLSLRVILNEVKNPFLSHTATAKVKEPWAGFFVALYAPHGSE